MPRCARSCRTSGTWTDPKYFPYRWGHAFWAYIGAKYGDRAVASLVRSAANPRIRPRRACRASSARDPDTLTAEWHDGDPSVRRAPVDGRAVAARESAAPRSSARDNGGGRYNVGPRVSPDGRRSRSSPSAIGFRSTCSWRTPRRGKVRRKLVDIRDRPALRQPAVPEFGRRVEPRRPHARDHGRARRAGPCSLLSTRRAGACAAKCRLPALDDALNPSFAPDGQSIVISGNRGGLLDLYRVSLRRAPSTS